jgi:acyl carrier protein
MTTIQVDSIVTELSHVIAYDLDARIEKKDVTPAIPLFEGGLALDSMVFFDLLTRIEKRYGITFPQENLNTQVFANLTVLAQNIVALMARDSAGAS